MNDDIQSLGDESNAFTEARSEPTSTITQNRTRTSWIWQHMDGGPDMILQVGASTFWRCKYCLSKYKINGGTRVIAEHLKSRHSKTDIKIDTTLRGVGQQIELAFARSVLNTHKRRKVFESELFDPRIFEELLIDWIAVNSISFKSCESIQFKALLTYLNKDSNAVLGTRNTLRAWTIQQYETRQKSLITELSLVTQKIHLSIDLWTGQGVAYIGIIGHYFDQFNQLKAPVLKFSEIQGAHTGENQAEHVLLCINQYDLASKLGYFMLDNATNNDTLMQHIQKGTLNLIVD